MPRAQIGEGSLESPERVAGIPQLAGVHPDGAALVLQPDSGQSELREKPRNLVGNGRDRRRSGRDDVLAGAGIPALDSVLAEHDQSIEPGSMVEPSQLDRRASGSSRDHDDPGDQAAEPAQRGHRIRIGEGLRRIVGDRRQGPVEIHGDEGGLRALQNRLVRPVADTGLRPDRAHGPSLPDRAVAGAEGAAGWVLTSRDRADG
jgi:hypothetical protein